MSRRTKTLILTASKLLQPEIVTNVADKIRHKRQVAKNYHDRKAQELPELEIGKGKRSKLPPQPSLCFEGVKEHQSPQPSSLTL